MLPVGEEIKPPNSDAPNSLFLSLMTLGEWKEESLKIDNLLSF